MRYYVVLRERVGVIVACTLLVVVAAVVYVKVAPRTYQAQAELLVAPASPNDAVESALPVLHQSGDPTEDVLTGASLVTTPNVAAAVVSDARLDMSAGAALADVQATPVGQAELVAVQATAPLPELAQELANDFATQTIAVSTATMHAAIEAELPTLKAQLLQIAPADRYGSTLGEQVDELEQLLVQSNPTLLMVARAGLPTGPSSPKTKLTVVAGLIAGIIVGICAAFLLHALDPRLRLEEQIRELTGLPILARIRRERLRRSSPMLPSDLSIAAQEGYRTLRTTLTARGPSTASRAYLVTGSGPGEGKSTTAINLAATLAQSGASVILIEADLRRPTFSAAFGVDVPIGIERVLAGGGVDLRSALVVLPFGDGAIHALAARKTNLESADLMSYDATSRLISSAKALADYVVIDSPPLTAVLDALPFAQLADEVVVVTRLDQTKRKRLIDLVELLHEYGASIAGVVMVGGLHSERDYYQGYLSGSSAESFPDPSAAAARRTIASISSQPAARQLVAPPEPRGVPPSADGERAAEDPAAR